MAVASEQACRTLAESIDWTPVGMVAGYSALAGEVDPAALLDQLERRSVNITLPALEGGRMLFRVREPGVALVPGPFRTFQPPETAPRVEVADHDVIIVPAVALDRFGTRVGHGQGFYDRCLAGITGVGATGVKGASVDDARRTLLIGIAHDFQLVDHLDRASWDVAMDLVVCGETGIWCAHPSAWNPPSQ